MTTVSSHLFLDSGSGLVLSMTTFLPSPSDRWQRATHFCQVPKVSWQNKMLRISVLERGFTFKNSSSLWKFDWLTHWPLGDLKKKMRKVIFQLISLIGGWGIFCKIALKWMSMDLTDDKSTLVQVMAWCRQATSHYLSQCWPRSVSPYGVSRPQWVNKIGSVLMCYQL